MGPARVQEIGALWLALAMVTTVAQLDRKNDQLCLEGLREGFSQSGDGVSRLKANWTGSDFPCEGSSPYLGLVCNSKRVMAIELAALSLEGTISTAVSFCENLGTLDLSRNRLSGSIPSALGSQLLQLTGVNLSFNSLSGTIPSSLGSLQRLTTFDVSHNRLEGLIPYTLSNTTAGDPRFNRSSFQGNKGLYGYPLPTPKRHNLSVPAIVGIGLASGVLSLFVSFAAVCCWLRGTERPNAADEGKMSQLVPENYR